MEPYVWEPYDYDAEEEDTGSYDGDEEYEGSEMDYDESIGVSKDLEAQKEVDTATIMNWSQSSPMLYFGLPFRGLTGFDQAFLGLLD